MCSFIQYSIRLGIWHIYQKHNTYHKDERAKRSDL